MFRGRKGRISAATRTGCFSLVGRGGCCSLFVPHYPETRAGLKYVWRSESQIDWRGEIQAAVDNVEIITIP